MTKLLVTGGTGTLGRVVVQELRHRHHEVIVLSRSVRSDVVTGNLLTGDGISDALIGVDVIVHCATGRDDVRAARNLISAARVAGNPHLVYISIVGVDRIPFSYYRSKFAVERLVENSGLPVTILRATQFHTLVAGIFEAQRLLPMLVAPSFSIQPIDVSEVSDRLVELATGAAAGRVTDIGGPQIRPAKELGTAWLTARASTRRVWPVRLPGRTFAAFRAGHNLTPDNPIGQITFDQFLETR